MGTPEEDQNPFAEREKEIVDKVLLKIDADKAAIGSYYGLIPTDLQERVNGLIDKNYPLLSEKIKMNYTTFREAFSKNWLAKREAFGQIAEMYGMKRVDSVYDLEDEPNEAAFAILTESSSYLFVGEGAFDTNGQGAALTYEKLPLRDDKTVSNLKVEKGGFFENMPQVGERAVVYTRPQKPDEKKHRRDTTPVMAMYVRENINAPRLNSDSVTSAFIDIDAKTMF